MTNKGMCKGTLSASRRFEFAASRLQAYLDRWQPRHGRCGSDHLSMRREDVIQTFEPASLHAESIATAKLPDRLHVTNRLAPFVCSIVQRQLIISIKANLPR